MTNSKYFYASSLNPIVLLIIVIYYPKFLEGNIVYLIFLGVISIFVDFIRFIRINKKNRFSLITTDKLLASIKYITLFKIHDYKMYDYVIIKKISFTKEIFNRTFILIFFLLLLTLNIDVFIVAPVAFILPFILEYFSYKYLGGQYYLYDKNKEMSINGGRF